MGPVFRRVAGDDAVAGGVAMPAGAALGDSVLGGVGMCPRLAGERDIDILAGNALLHTAGALGEEEIATAFDLDAALARSAETSPV